MSAGFGPSAILIFTRTASEEAAHKTFVQRAGKKSNRNIAVQLIRQTIATAKRTKLPVFVHDSNAQQAQTFGKNLADALESVFARGYERVMVIGNDSPKLKSSTLLESNKQLTHNPLVLGPSTDGGVYLIGIQQAAYQRQAFLELPWETAKLQGAFEQYLSQHTIQWLEPLCDLDHAADFKAFLSKISHWNPLRSWFQSILASLRPLLVFELRKPLSVAFQGATLLRGPPV
jgi:hypothetical protein